MLVYRFLKVAVPTTFRVFLRRVYLSNRRNIPRGKPVILAANHSNAFLDGAIISYFLLRRTYALVRGDVFRKSWANRLLKSTGLLPIYRSMDGIDQRNNLKQNHRTFEDCFKLFRRNHLILIFSEAVAKIEKRLKPLKKGTARLAFDFMEESNWECDLQVVSTSVNYTFFKGFRKEVMIDFALPIRVLDYKQQYQDNNNLAIAVLTSEIAGRLQEILIISKYNEYDDLLDKLLQLTRNNLKLPFFGFLFYGNKRINAERNAAKTLNTLIEDHPEKAMKMKEELQNYFLQLNQLSLQDKAIAGIGSVWLKLIMSIIFIVPVSAIFVLSVLPYLIALFLTKKLVRKDEFYDSMLFGFSLGFSLVYNLLLGIVLIWVMGWTGIFLFLGIKLGGIFSLFVFEACQDVVQFIRAIFLRISNPNAFGRLKEIRKELVI